MSEKHAVNEKPGGAGWYEIRIKGHLDDRWTDWFADVAITREANGDTLLVSTATDQAALHGLLKKVRDLGMPLVSVNFVNPGQAETQQPKL